MDGLKLSGGPEQSPRRRRSSGGVSEVLRTVGSTTQSDTTCFMVNFLALLNDRGNRVSDRMRAISFSSRILAQNCNFFLTSNGIGECCELKLWALLLMYSRENFNARKRLTSKSFDAMVSGGGNTVAATVVGLAASSLPPVYPILMAAGASCIIRKAVRERRKRVDPVGEKSFKKAKEAKEAQPLAAKRLLGEVRKALATVHLELMRRVTYKVKSGADSEQLEIEVDLKLGGAIKLRESVLNLASLTKEVAEQGFIPGINEAESNLDLTKVLNWCDFDDVSPLLRCSGEFQAERRKESAKQTVLGIIFGVAGQHVCKKKSVDFHGFGSIERKKEVRPCSGSALQDTHEIEMTLKGVGCAQSTSKSETSKEAVKINNVIIRAKTQGETFDEFRLDIDEKTLVYMRECLEFCQSLAPLRWEDSHDFRVHQQNVQKSLSDQCTRLY